MAFAIPRIQYKNYTVAGNTSSGSALVTALTTTTGLEVGMFVRGTGIPTGAKILTVDSSTQVTLDMNATANGTGVSFDFGFEILFDYPPKEKYGEKLDSKERVSVAISGVQQTSVDFIEAKRELKFSFLTETIKTKMDTFYKTWAGLGKEFRYFEDQTLTPYTVYELKNLKYNPEKIAPKGVDIYVWEIGMDFRRVI